MSVPFFIAFTVVTFPGFGKVMFRKKYGIAQRILRWVIGFGIFVLMFIVMGALFP